MRNLTLEPDEHMRWIYDPSHPGYDSQQAEWLRGRREHAIANAPEWMKLQAELNAAWMRRYRARGS